MRLIELNINRRGDVMKISDKGLVLIKSFEGCHLDAYKCPAGVWTIGYGHTKGVYQGMKITQSQADSFLREDCNRFEKNVNSFASKYNWTQNEFDALVCFAFNIGSINKLTGTPAGTRTKEEIAATIRAYNKDATGKVLPGLVRRRQAEYELFTTGVKNMTNTVLQKGAQGKEVKELQNGLIIRGYNLGKVDGDFGEKTETAVEAFQKDAGLKVDGVVGENTRNALEKIKVLSVKADGDKAVSKNFKVKEFACKDGSDRLVLDEEFISSKLQKIRTHFGVPVTINSAYRNAAYNKKVGGSSNSYHVKGRAFDIVVKGKTPAEVARYAKSIGIKGVIQYNTFVHIDSRPKKYYARNNNGKVTVVNNF